MTAEIAVMNRGAIALAADSKVTVTTGGVTKTYDTVSKLFTLSKVAPVGVMIYGNADFMGYPWETIIKLYRRAKGVDVEDTIAEWGVDFFNFLDKFGNITQEDKENNVYSICLSALIEVLRLHEDWAIYNSVNQGSPEFDAGLQALFSRRYKDATSCEPWLPKRQHAAFIKKNAPLMGQAIEQALGGFSDDTKREAAIYLVATLILQASSPQVSGIVIAGFGEKEYFPTLVEYRTDGYVGSKIKKYLVPPVIDVSRSFTASIRAFAQHDMVQRFMDGIDARYSMYLSEAIPELVIDNCFGTLEKYGTNKSKKDEIREKIKEAVEEAVNEFEKEAHKYRQEYFSDPVIRMVSVLPKDELAHLAESLVALTSLKRRVSSDAETVGGPVDVALISKGDGFVWIKRKYYFDESLNRQFVNSYMDDVKHGERYESEPRRAKGSRGNRTARPARQPNLNGKGDAPIST